MKLKNSQNNYIEKVYLQTGKLDKYKKEEKKLEELESKFVGRIKNTQSIHR